MDYICSVEERDAQPVLSIRTRVPVTELPQMFSRSYGSIMQYLISKGVTPSGPPFATYYNMDMQNLDVEAGFPVPERIDGSGTITPSYLPAGKLATCLHIGPYDKIEPAYQSLSQWVSANGYEPTGVACEFYLNDPDKTAPEELQTLIAFRLK